MHTEDQEIIAELKTMARIYQRLGKNLEAARMLELARSVEDRLHRTAKRRTESLWGDHRPESA